MNIAIVNDVSMICTILKKIIIENSNHKVIWTAEDGRIAVEKAQQATPDLILMDLIMPVMDGVEATREIMKATPCAIVLVTASVDQNADMVFSAMAHGALDAISTPNLSASADQEGITPLLHKLKIIERLVSPAGAIAPIEQTPKLPILKNENKNQFPLICIGASTGGPGALDIVLSHIPADLGAAIVIVQHVDADFTPGLADWLNTQAALEVKVAQTNMNIEINKVYIAGGDEHLLIDVNGKFYFNAEPRELFYRPSIDVFFNSVVSHWNGTCVGVLLTGMGDDGAKGLLALKNKSAFTIAQDEASSAVYGMPRAAAKLNAAQQILPIEKISNAILSHL
ncbi:MAG: chemotaxis-specific protein-glutamate methyltransferase CheB [Gammaproteobacteria bacterium]|nr:chemotaxis-specific protein-glutamate methyltransferase CheB [Gammaproteobacteria bacterium]